MFAELATVQDKILKWCKQVHKIGIQANIMQNICRVYKEIYRYDTIGKINPAVFFDSLGHQNYVYYHFPRCQFYCLTYCSLIACLLDRWFMSCMWLWDWPRKIKRYKSSIISGVIWNAIISQHTCIMELEAPCMYSSLYYVLKTKPFYTLDC